MLQAGKLRWHCTLQQPATGQDATGQPLPGWVDVAPVKAPRSWPNSADSNKFSGRLEQSTATSGRCARSLASCTARATSSLPVPDSPSSSTVACDGATRATSASMC